MCILRMRQVHIRQTKCDFLFFTVFFRKNLSGYASPYASMLLFLIIGERRICTDCLFHSLEMCVSAFSHILLHFRYNTETA